MKVFDPPAIADERQLERFRARSLWSYGIGAALLVVAALGLAYLDDSTPRRMKGFPVFLVGFWTGVLVASGGSGLKMVRLYRRLLGLAEDRPGG